MAVPDADPVVRVTPPELVAAAVWLALFKVKAVVAVVDPAWTVRSEEAPVVDQVEAAPAVRVKAAPEVNEEAAAAAPPIVMASAPPLPRVMVSAPLDPKVIVVAEVAKRDVPDTVSDPPRVVNPLPVKVKVVLSVPLPKLMALAVVAPRLINPLREAPVPALITTLPPFLVPEDPELLPPLMVTSPPVAVPVMAPELVTLPALRTRLPPVGVVAADSSPPLIFRAPPVAEFVARIKGWMVKADPAPMVVRSPVELPPTILTTPVDGLKLNLVDETLIDWLPEAVVTQVG